MYTPIICTYTHMPTYVYTYMFYAYMYIYIYTYIHTYTYTNRSLRRCPDRELRAQRGPDPEVPAPAKQPLAGYAEGAGEPTWFDGSLGMWPCH